MYFNVIHGECCKRNEWSEHVLENRFNREMCMMQNMDVVLLCAFFRARSATQSIFMIWRQAMNKSTNEWEKVMGKKMI